MSKIYVLVAQEQEYYCATVTTIIAYTHSLEVAEKWKKTEWPREHEHWGKDKEYYEIDLYNKDAD